MKEKKLPSFVRAAIQNKTAEFLLVKNKKGDNEKRRGYFYQVNNYSGEVWKYKLERQKDLKAPKMNKQYLETCRLVLEKGQKKKDRTGVGTISYFGTKMEFDLRQGENFEEFIKKIKQDQAFAQKYGDLGPIYGKQ
ncbi:7813_t:CDS:2 [Entrophospora sp. SA101]|nr:7813_t:CDS:2 [Entrophospora sp. SA101]